MCHQAVGLVAAALESIGIVTVSLTMMPAVTRKVRPPRALAVPFPLGYPLGSPCDAALQRHVLRALLSLATRDDVPVLETFSLPTA
jgi:hypothetical protein